MGYSRKCSENRGSKTNQTTGALRVLKEGHGRLQNKGAGTGCVKKDDIYAPPPQDQAKQSNHSDLYNDLTIKIRQKCNGRYENKKDLRGSEHN